MAKSVDEVKFNKNPVPRGKKQHAEIQELVTIYTLVFNWQKSSELNYGSSKSCITCKKTEELKELGLHVVIGGLVAQ